MSGLANCPVRSNSPAATEHGLTLFEADWPWVVTQPERDNALQATTLFALLRTLNPGRYQAGQVRTFQEHIATWRAQHGPTREVMFPQIHRPGVDAQSDFTHMESLGITLGGVPFPHLVFHLVLSYSNIEAIQIRFSESFESLIEGIETCLWSIGGVPQRQHRTDHLGAAIHPLDAEGRAEAKDRYSVVMRHYGLEATTNNLGVAHENGDAVLRPLPGSWLALCRELRVRVSRFSTIQVLRNTYSVPSRLIGTGLLVRVR
jgi:hypothetical protein